MARKLKRQAQRKKTKAAKQKVTAKKQPRPRAERTERRRERTERRREQRRQQRRQQQQGPQSGPTVNPNATEEEQILAAFEAARPALAVEKTAGDMLWEMIQIGALSPGRRRDETNRRLWQGD